MWNFHFFILSHLFVNRPCTTKFPIGFLRWFTFDSMFFPWKNISWFNLFHVTLSSLGWFNSCFDYFCFSRNINFFLSKFSCNIIFTFLMLQIYSLLFVFIHNFAFNRLFRCSFGPFLLRNWRLKNVCIMNFIFKTNTPVNWSCLVSWVPELFLLFCCSFWIFLFSKLTHRFFKIGKSNHIWLGVNDIFWSLLQNTWTYQFKIFTEVAFFKVLWWFYFLINTFLPLTPLSSQFINIFIRIFHKSCFLMWIFYLCCLLKIFIIY